MAMDNSRQKGKLRGKGMSLSVEGAWEPVLCAVVTSLIRHPSRILDFGFARPACSFPFQRR